VAVRKSSWRDFRDIYFGINAGESHVWENMGKNKKALLNVNGLCYKDELCECSQTHRKKFQKMRREWRR